MKKRPQPWKKVEQCVLALVLVFLLLLGGAYFSLNNARALEKVVPIVVHLLVKDVRVTGMTVGQSSFDNNGFWKAENVRFQVDRANQTFEFSSESMSFDNLLGFFRNPAQATLYCSNADLKSSFATLEGLSLSIRFSRSENRYYPSAGNLRARQMQVAGISVTDIQAQLSGNENSFKIQDLSANSAGGNITGNISVANTSDRAYIMHIEFNNVDLSRMPGGAGAALKKVRGVIQGVLQIRGTRTELIEVKGFIRAPQGSEIPAVYLKPILLYIPSSNQKKVLEQLIITNKDILLETSDVDISGVSAQQMRLKLYMKSQKLNLDMRVTIDLKAEDGLKELFGSIQRVL